jgi:ATP-dependent RNA helicase SUPV3L1/SUV3
VALYQAGEVDYLVATDAIGMGLNLDIAHVALLASPNMTGGGKGGCCPPKWRRSPGAPGGIRRTAPLARWRAGGAWRAGCRFEDEEIYAIEEHASPPDAALLARIRSALRSVAALMDRWSARPRIPR